MSIEQQVNPQYDLADVVSELGKIVNLDAFIKNGRNQLEGDATTPLHFSDYAPLLYDDGPVVETRLIERSSPWDGATCYEKREADQLTGAFKVRGGTVSVAAALAINPDIQHLAIYSAGNAGLGMTHAVQFHNERHPDRQLQAHVFCASGISSAKSQPLTDRGATLHTYDLQGQPHMSLEHAARSAAEFVEANEAIARLVQPFNHPAVMAAHGTPLLEATAQLWEAGIDTRLYRVIEHVGAGGLSLGNGSGVGMGVLLGAGLVAPGSRVVAWQMERCDAQRRVLNGENPDRLFIDAKGEDTFDPSADGTAVRKPAESSLRVSAALQRLGILQMGVVSKPQVGAAMIAAKKEELAVEPAGALGRAGMEAELTARTRWFVAENLDYPEIHIYVASGSNVSRETMKDFSLSAKEIPSASHRLNIVRGVTEFRGAVPVEPRS